MDSHLDQDGQPLEKGYHRGNNRRKAFYSLLGIAEGLTADNELTPDEVTFLDVWLKENQDLHKDPDYQDLVDIVEDVLADGLLTHDELTDLLGMLNTIVEIRGDEAFSSERGEMEFLLGFLRGISADQELNEFEILALRAWLNHTMLSTEKWPASVLVDRIRRIVSDRCIEREEADDLLETINDIIGKGMELGVPTGISTNLPVTEVGTLHIAGKSFCITGKLASGPRRRCEEAIRSHGGIPLTTVTKRLDYLVIGTLASRDWAQTSYGTKIEKAMKIRDTGGELIIVSEETLYEFL